MTRDEAQAAMLNDVQGYDGGEGYDPEGPGFGADDAVSRAGLTTLAVQLSVANAAALDINLFSQEHLDNAALPTGLVSVNSVATLAAYKKLLRYFQANPCIIRSINFHTSEAGNNAPLLNSVKVTPTRDNSFGATQTNTKLVASHQTSGDFQANRVSFPIVCPLDTITFLRFQSDTNASGGTVTINLNIFIGKRAEIRRLVPTTAARPVTMRPQGRGPVAV